MTDSILQPKGTKMSRLSILCVSTMMAIGVNTVPARADLKLCNNTENKVGVAIGYKDNEGWASEGWWTVEPEKCLTLLKGPLIARYYYVYAVDRKVGGSWGGKSQMCVRDKAFTIRGLDNCEQRGYQKQEFFEVDTGEKTDHTISLTGAKTTQGQQ